MFHTNCIITSGVCCAIAICLLVSAVPGKLVSTVDWRDRADQVSEEIDGVDLEGSALVDQDYSEAGSDDHGDSVATRAGCEGYTCQMLSSCGLAPLNPLSRPRSAVEPYIVNGDDQIHGEWPSFARIGIKYKDGRGSMCGGTIVSDMHILTATHCIYRKESAISSIDARLGDHSTRTTTKHEKIYYSSFQCLSSSYVKAPNPRYDWAIVTLKNRINFTNYIQPACLPYGFTGRPKYKHCHAVGAGSTGYDSKGSSIDKPVIQKQRVRQVSCATSGFILGDDQFQACYTKATGTGSICYGDSGGPILCLDNDTKRWTVIGIATSVRLHCDGKEWVSGFTRITTSLPKIKAECRI